VRDTAFKIGGAGENTAKPLTLLISQSYSLHCATRMCMEIEMWVSFNSYFHYITHQISKTEYEKLKYPNNVCVCVCHWGLNSGPYTC
jgi:hypothetical protein